MRRDIAHQTWVSVDVPRPTYRTFFLIDREVEIRDTLREPTERNISKSTVLQAVNMRTGCLLLYQSSLRR